MKAAATVLVVVFALSGGAKLAGLEFEVQAFARWGYPPWFMYAVGAAEAAGALALLTRRYGALAALAALMVGALATHLAHAEWGMLALATAIFALCVGCAWQGRDEIRALWRASAASRA